MAFVDTSTDMVQVIHNIIGSYGMGPIRALAQEPVQNSKDAKRQGRVHVEYRLLSRQSMDGRPCHLLTVTDSGTTGLQGPILPRKQRDERGPELEAGENWAAFEGQGYTRKDQGDAIGSRGQGKSAFLYHSQPTDSNGNRLERHLMLYDTLLEDGEYRLGVRYAMPADRVMEPPFLNGHACEIISDVYDTGDGTVVPLQLDPLELPGTRVIVPYVSEEAVEAIRNGELHRWLQRCWWRAIQIGGLEICVVDDRGRTRTIGVPDWWRDEPWNTEDRRVSIAGPTPIEDGLAIKRVVLLHDENLEKDEIDGYGAQYSGVQVLRGQQWIETLDAGEYIPKEHRGGFRGFVEFDVQLERKLKVAERPQHESFDRRYHLVKRFREEVSRAVRLFAEERGWRSEAEMHDVSEREQNVATEFLRVFASGTGSTRRRRGSGNAQPANEESINWSCQLELDFPTPKSARVNWGESISNVRVTAECEPAEGSKWVDVSLEIYRDSDSTLSRVAHEREIVVQDGIAITDFGDFQVVQGRDGAGKMHVPEPGEWKLRATVRHSGEDVDSAMRRLYVAMDPPDPRPSKPQTISVSAKNVTRQGERRINDGDEIAIQVTVTNRAADDAVLRVDARLGESLRADGKEVNLEGVPTGDVPNRKAVVSERLRVYTSPHSVRSEAHLVLRPGRHDLVADLWSPDLEEPIAHASQAVYVEINPSGSRRNQLPFELESVEGDGLHPMWCLEEQPSDSWVLRYPSQYPLYRHLPERQRLSSKLAGKLSFIAEVCANGLLEWALAPLANGDSSRMEQLKDNRPSGVGTRRWDAYCERIDRLVESYDRERIEHTGAYMSQWRESVADMLEIFEGLE